MPRKSPRGWPESDDRGDRSMKGRAKPRKALKSPQGAFRTIAPTRPLGLSLFSGCTAGRVFGDSSCRVGHPWPAEQYGPGGTQGFRSMIGLVFGRAKRHTCSSGLQVSARQFAGTRARASYAFWRDASCWTRVSFRGWLAPMLCMRQGVLRATERTELGAFFFGSVRRISFEDAKARDLGRNQYTDSCSLLFYHEADA